MAHTDEAELIALDEPINETEVDPSVAHDVLEFHDNVTSDENEDEDEDSSRRDLYRNTILGSWAYRWLMASLKRESTLKRPTLDLLLEFETTILSALPTSYHQLSQGALSKTFKAVFELDWSPVQFLREQKYTEDGDDDDLADLGSIITLTGELDDAQATTSKFYMSQTWPMTGPHTLQLVIDTIQDAIFHQATGKFKKEQMS